MGWWRRFMDALEAKLSPLSWIAKRVKFGPPTQPMAGNEGSDNALREVKKR